MEEPAEEGATSAVGRRSFRTWKVLGRRGWDMASISRFTAVLAESCD